MSFKGGWKGAGAGASFVEQDTLQSVTDRGASTNKTITVASINSNAYNSYFVNRVNIGGHYLNGKSGYGIQAEATNEAIALFHAYLQNSANAIGILTDTQNTLTDANAKLLSVRNKGIEKFHIGADGATLMKNSKFRGYTESAEDPTTTELPNDKDFCIHYNTTSSTLYLAVNKGGVIKKVALS